jgi:hypothetical protein
MPNWCYNSINITGHKDKIKALWDMATGDNEHGLLHGLAPMPAELIPTLDGERLAEPYQGFDHWYDWRLDKWGAKWEIDAENLAYETDGTTATLSGWFESAWSSPLEALKTYADANPDVEIEVFYQEEGMDFAGLWRSNGEESYIDSVSESLDDHKNGQLSSLEDEVYEFFDIVEQAELEAEWEKENANA